jgi:hypothetical protein
MDMGDEYIFILQNLMALSKISKWYPAVGLRGAYSSMDVANVK